ncbi:hypothetical protein BM526_18805 (plasmid) [Alteromonas mediterranea]|uniref:hypothetical protein n=1 Tax=Alteromonas mediterranea TaxID=314275 RepID=UPI000903933B|nr:hypothetical protein [Alteromonas mediterranea]APE04351.1 hypothetical protein BM526_18805 [Alteromonas mediterranea]
MASDLHKELCFKASKFLMNNGFSVAFDDRLQAASGSGEFPDALGFRNGVSCLIEVKVSRSDFLADKKKRFRVEPSLGMGDWRFYLSPPDVISSEDLPEGWGLLHYVRSKIVKVEGWPPNTQWIFKKPFEANKQSECDVLYSALRRIKKSGHLDAAYLR